MSKISILAPSPIRGSGGVCRIYTFAKALHLTGHQCDIYVFDCGDRKASDLSVNVKDFYAIEGVCIYAGLKLEQDYDLIIATRWDTAKIVRDMPAQKKAYLIQDFEACFNPVGDGTILAENSYLYGLQSITYGRWLALKLYREFGNTPYYCDFASDLTTFKVIQPMKERITKRLAICFIYQHDKPRRCPQLGIDALGIVKHLRPDVEIYFVGSNHAPKLWYDYTNAGLLNTKELNELYNQCHVGFCLSSSNPSCNAFDMMAAGLPSVELYRENNLFDIPDEGVSLAHQTPESLAEALIRLISNPETLIQMSNFGVDFMKSRSSANEVNEFLLAIDNILSGKTPNFNAGEIMSQRYTAEPVIADAYKNGSIHHHVNSQMSKCIEATEPVANFQIHSKKPPSFVTNQTINYTPTYVHANGGLISKIKRAIKQLLAITQ